MKSSGKLMVRIFWKVDKKCEGNLKEIRGKFGGN